MVLRQLQIDTGKSLKELERVAAASDSSLSRYLKGTALPPWSVVDALCRAADREPTPVHRLWQDARRERAGQRADRPAQEESAAAPRQPEPGADADADADAYAEPEPRAGTDAITRTPAPVPPGLLRGLLRPLVLLPVAAVVAASVAVTLVWGGGDDHGARSVLLCPWQYIVTDGVPSPVVISDRADERRRHIATYAPNQIFWAYDPVRSQNGQMRTTEGWITKGDWIRRYPSACRYA